MKIRRATINDAKFVFACEALLLNKDHYTFDAFKQYFRKVLLLNNQNTQIWIATVKGKRVGMITLNKFLTPRYIGYGFDMEEVAIIKKEQRKGYGRKFIKMLIDELSSDLNLRKITIKTNDQSGAGELYKSIFNSTDFKTYQVFINKI